MLDYLMSPEINQKLVNSTDSKSNKNPTKIENVKLPKLSMDIKRQSNTSNKMLIKKFSKKKDHKKSQQDLKILIKMNGEKKDALVSRKGGSFQLAGNAVIEVDERTFLKSPTVITSAVVSPNKRQDIMIHMQYGDCLVSEIFVLFSKSAPRKAFNFMLPTTLQRAEPKSKEEYQSRESTLPSDNHQVSESCRYCCLIGFNLNTMSWTIIPKERVKFTQSAAIFKSTQWGIFAILKKAPFDTIKINEKGGVFYSSIAPLFLLTVPKFANKQQTEYTIQVFDLDEATMRELSSCYPTELSNFVSVSQFFSFSLERTNNNPDKNESFIRPVNIRLSLPKWIRDAQTKTDGDMLSGSMLFVKKYGKWEKLKTQITCTNMTFSFYINYLGTFVLLRPRPNRDGKVRSSMSRLEHICRCRVGALLVFLRVEHKQWFLMVEAAEMSRVESIRRKRSEEGFVFLQQMVNNKAADSKMKYTGMGLKKTGTEICGQIVELIDGAIFTLSLSSGCLQVKPSSYSPYLVSKQFSHAFVSTIKRQSLLSQTSSNQLLQSQPKSAKSNPEARIFPPVSQKSKESDTHQYVESINYNNAKLSDKTKHMLGADNLKRLSPVTENRHYNIEEEYNKVMGHSNEIQLVYHSQMIENYRIVELEPKPSIHLHEEVIDKLRRWCVLQEENEEGLDQDSELEDFSSVKNNLRDSTNMYQEEPRWSGSASSKSPTSGKIDLLFWKAASLPSQRRTEPASDIHEKLMFDSVVVISPSPHNITLPPNQLTIEDELASRSARPRRSSSKFVHLQMQKNVYKFKFYLKPEEMREYLSLARPTPSEIAATKSKMIEELFPEAELLKDEKSGNTISIAQIRDCKVLNNASFDVLSSYVKQGLKLAIHLSLPDSFIAQFGLEAIESRLSLSQVSYHVLMTWRNKKMAEATRKKLPASFVHLDLLHQLFAALGKVGLDRVVLVMNAAIRQNSELTFKLMDQDNALKLMCMRQ